jgi:hypothetical protein
MAELEDPHRRRSVTPGPTPAVLELYKLAVESADRVTARRGTANSFYLTVQTAFIAVLAVAAPQGPQPPTWQAAVASTAGVTLSVCWWLQLRSYRDLNRAKFEVIIEVEKQLPVKVFTDEWNSLKKDPIRPWRQRYSELGTVERVVPWIFAGLYVTLFVAEIAR